VLNPIKILSGSFGGPVLYENPNFVSPNEIRSLVNKKSSYKYEDRIITEEKRVELREDLQLPDDELDQVFKEGDVADEDD